MSEERTMTFDDCEFCGLSDEDCLRGTVLAGETCCPDCGHAAAVTHPSPTQRTVVALVLLVSCLAFGLSSPGVFDGRDLLAVVGVALVALWAAKA